MFTKFLMLSALAVCSFGYSETTRETLEDRSFHLGIQAGAIFSDVAGPADISTSNRAGLAAGVNFDIPLNAWVSIQPEVLFAQRGYNLTVGDVEVQSRYSSFELPVFAKVKLPGTISPFLVAGPALIFNFGESVSASAPGGTISAGINPRTFDLGAAVGGGVEVGPVFATVRYTVGITDLDENSADYHSRGVHVLGGVRL